MKKQYLLIFTILLSTLTVFSQDYSNKGKDFWIGYGNHVRMFNQGSPEMMEVYITSDVNTKGLVEIAAIGFSYPYTVVANQITKIEIPRSAALFNEGLYNTGIHITSELPVVVYSFIYVNAMSGATLVLPTNTLGTEYYSVNFTQISNEPNSYSYFFVVATEDSTAVVITPSRKTKNGRPANVPFTVKLNKGDIYQVLGADGQDLTGSKIQSISQSGSTSGCKRVAVYCGSGKVSIGCGGPGTSDNLYQQIYPKNSWGKKYITVPSTTRAKNFQNNYYRVIRPDTSTIVKVNGQVIPYHQFTDNFYYEFSNNTTNVIEADKPIFLAQYFTSQGCSNNAGQGDPEMIYLNPVEQTINRVTLNSMQPSSGTNINTHFINVVMTNHPSAIQSFKIDGVSYSSSFSPVLQDNGYAYARIEVNKGAHTITCDSGFNAIAYGFGEYESYGYSAGSNLKDLYQYATIENKFAIVDFPATCKDAPFYFSIVFPYQPLNMKWTFNGLFKDTAIISPKADSSWEVNGKRLYYYRLEKEYVMDKTGTFPIKVFTDNPTIDGCSGTQEINFNLQVYLKPNVLFQTKFDGCLYDSLHLKDSSISERKIQRWNWDLGDGTTNFSSQLSHKYAKPGTYTIKFSALNDIGCFSDTASQIIKIDSLPIADFKIPPINCVNDSVLFTNISTLPPGLSGRYIFNFGNGDSIVATNLNPVQYKFSQEKDYTISLQAITEKGCKSAVVQKPLKINYSPIVDFVLPDVCLKDSHASFENKTTIGDHTESQFTYLWGFDDAGNSGPTNPNTASTKNGTHSYARADHYNVSLKVTSIAGCVSDTTKIFTVNGANPTAAFNVLNENLLCSNESVVFKDGSSVDFGKITRIEILWDRAGDITKSTTDDTPDSGKNYVFNYGNFGSPSSKEYQIEYKAYSGSSCVNTITRKISVLATPQLVFSPMSPICAEKPPILLTAGKETASLSGSGIYRGPGITDGMNFNPGVAAAGLHTLTYLFQANNGCKDSITQKIEVLPTPLVDAGPDLTLLEGLSIQIKATATGNGLKYLWTPALGISPIDSLIPTVAISDDQLYTLKVTSADGCVAKDDVFIKVLKEVKVPNAFTPNGDNIHDTWQIKYLDNYPNATIIVFNRYGQEVYRSVGYSKPWDGTNLGKPLPMGTYYYIIDPKNGRAKISGSVTIIR